jgi:hypothetical protein
VPSLARGRWFPFPAAISDRVRRGELARFATGVYTSDVASDPAAVVAREWHDIAGRMFPDAVITDRSAVIGESVDGVLYLDASRGRMGAGSLRHAAVPLTSARRAGQRRRAR